MSMGFRRILSALIAFCLIAVLFGGCEEKENNHGLDPKSPTSITIWHYYNGVQQEYFDKLLVEFNETVGREMGIVVEAHNKNSIPDLAENSIASLRGDVGADRAPDMFAAYAGTAYTADKLGKVADLSGYFTKEELAEYVEGYLEEGDINSSGELKIFPIAKSTEVMMLNLTDWQVFADATGVSFDDLSTWEGVAEVAEKYYDYTDALTPGEPNDGKAFFGRDSVANYMVVGGKQLGIEYIVQENGALNLQVDKDAVKRLWDCYYAPYVKGHFLSRGRYRSDDAQTGDIIAMVCSSTGATYFPQTVTPDDEHAYPIKSYVTTVPNFAGTEPYVVQQGAGMVVTKSDEKKEYACSVFLKWFTEQDRSSAFAAGSGYSPVKKAANDFDAISAYLTENNSAGAVQLAVVEVAATEISSYELYASKPHDNAEEVRDFLGDHIQNTAEAAHDAAYARIESGEDRDSVLSEYVSDEAFETWYEGFISGLKSAAGI